jgi:hypothetical protein
MGRKGLFDMDYDNDRDLNGRTATREKLSWIDAEKPHGSVKSCGGHIPTLVYKLDTVEFFGGTKDRISPMDDIDLLVNCTGFSKFSSKSDLVEGSEKWLKRLTPHLIAGKFEEIVLDWRDREFFPARIGFWRSLYDGIKEDGFKKVCFCCTGGHGRTGTALASMLAVINKNSGDRAIEYVRDTYCKKAVEGREQEEYVRRLGAAAKK